MINLKIFGEEIIDIKAKDQMLEAMKNKFVVKGALMPDSHLGYSLPIGGVVATEDVIVPAWVGYDIGCGMSAIKTTIKKQEIKGKEKDIFDNIYKNIPVSMGEYHKTDQKVKLNKPKTKVLEEIMIKRNGLKQIGTLGGGNHFIEISYDEQDFIWIIVHSGSRGIGYGVASHYMDIAKTKNFKKEHLSIISGLEKEFDSNDNLEGIRTHNPEKYEELKGIFIERELIKLTKGNLEGHYGLDVNSKEGKNYILDMNFCLDFALENRKLMIINISNILYDMLGKKSALNLVEKELGGGLINRNHNHCELKDNLWIHRKGATHSEKGMYGVIPGNMRDGSFIVKGKGNPDSLFSSSHGAGRRYGRKEAQRKLNIKDFEKQMDKIQAKVELSTLDESPDAYKDIFEVMKYQEENIEVINYLKPLINIKG